MANGWVSMSDTEKITINLGVVDLGQIDLLVGRGFYSNRTDFIRTAIRNHLSAHASDIRQTETHSQFVIGITYYNREDLEKVRARNEMLTINVVGRLILASDVTPELARATIKSVRVLGGGLQASKEVKAALADRLR